MLRPNNGECIKQYSQPNLNGCFTSLLSLSNKRCVNESEQRSPCRFGGIASLYKSDVVHAYKQNFWTDRFGWARHTNECGGCRSHMRYRPAPWPQTRFAHPCAVIGRSPDEFSCTRHCWSRRLNFCGLVWVRLRVLLDALATVWWQHPELLFHWLKYAGLFFTFFTVDSWMNCCTCTLGDLDTV